MLVSWLILTLYAAHLHRVATFCKNYCGGQANGTSADDQHSALRPVCPTADKPVSDGHKSPARANRWDLRFARVLSCTVRRHA